MAIAAQARSQIGGRRRCRRRGFELEPLEVGGRGSAYRLRDDPFGRLSDSPRVAERAVGETSCCFLETHLMDGVGRASKSPRAVERHALPFEQVSDALKCGTGSTFVLWSDKGCRLMRPKEHLQSIFIRQEDARLARGQCARPRNRRGRRWVCPYRAGVR
jgi:hypothetical protein